MKRIVRLNRLGQASTELAIFAMLLLIAFGALISYGQSMSAQQEIRMNAFRQALNKAYNDYDSGSGVGATSYTAIKHIRIVSPFSQYYDGSQRSSVSGGASVLWDPDLMYQTDAQANYYLNLDGAERNLGQTKVADIVTNTVNVLHGAEIERKMDGTGITEHVRASATENLTTTIKTEESGDILVTSEETVTKDETWITSY